MNHTVEFRIKANLIDCYLYAGYLFLIMTNGRIVYVSYHRVIHMLKERYPQYASLIDLIFLHNEYINSYAGKIILGVKEIKDELRRLWVRAARSIDFTISFEDIEPHCEQIGEWESMPLDIRMYAMRMFLATKNGLYESRLNMEKTNQYRIHPSGLEKLFDAKIINVNSRNGSLVLSADKDGLFGAQVFDGEIKTRVNEKEISANRSVRASWADVCDLMNYESAQSFEYIKNRASVITKQPALQYRFGDSPERKRIVSFGEAIYNMETLLRVADFKKDDIDYCFNSSKTGFFILKDGRFLNVNFRSESGEAEVYFSSASKTQPSLSKSSQAKRVLSGNLVPQGCVIEFFDRVVLYQKGKAYTLAQKPVNSVRTYMGSNKYRDLVSIISSNEVAFHSVDSFDVIDSRPAFINKTRLIEALDEES